MTIHIEALTFDVIIGLLDFEREKPQTVIIDLEIKYTYENENFIDYGDIALAIQSHLKEIRYTLLENALLGLKEILYKSYPHMESLSIKISKPNIIPECNVALSDRWDFNT